MYVYCASSYSVTVQNTSVTTIPCSCIVGHGLHGRHHIQMYSSTNKVIFNLDIQVHNYSCHGLNHMDDCYNADIKRVNNPLAVMQKTMTRRCIVIDVRTFISYHHFKSICDRSCPSMYIKISGIWQLRTFSLDCWNLWGWVGHFKQHFVFNLYIWMRSHFSNVDLFYMN